MPYFVHVRENMSPESKSEERVAITCASCKAAQMAAAAFRLKYPAGRAFVTDDRGFVVPREDFDDCILAEGGAS